MTFSELVDLVYEAAELGNSYLVEADEKGKTRGKLSPEEWASMVRGARTSASMPKRVKQQTRGEDMTPEELAAHAKKAEEFAPLTPEERIAARQSEADYMSSVEDLSPQEEKNLKELKQRNARRQAFLEREREKARAEIEQGTVGGEKRKEESEYERTRYQELRDKEERNALGRERKYGPVNLRSNQPGETEERPFDIKQWEAEVARKRERGEEGIVLPSTLESGKKPFAPDPKGLTAAPNLPSISHIKKDEALHWSQNPNAAPGFIHTDKGLKMLRKESNKDQKRRLRNIFKSVVSMGAGPKLEAAMKPYIDTYLNLRSVTNTYNSSVYNIIRLGDDASRLEDALAKCEIESTSLHGVLPKLFERILKIEESIKTQQEKRHRLIKLIQSVTGTSFQETKRLRASAQSELDECTKILDSLEKNRRELQHEIDIHEREVPTKGDAAATPVTQETTAERQRQQQIRAHYEQLQTRKKQLKAQSNKALDELMHATPSNESEIRDRLNAAETELKQIETEIKQIVKLFSSFKPIEQKKRPIVGSKQLADKTVALMDLLTKRLWATWVGREAKEEKITKKGNVQKGRSATQGLYGYGGVGGPDNIHPKSYTGRRDQAVDSIINFADELDEMRDSTYEQMLDIIMPLGIDIRSMSEWAKEERAAKKEDYVGHDPDETVLGTIQRWYDFILNDVRKSYVANILDKPLEPGESREFVSAKYNQIDPIFSLYNHYISAKLNVERALRRKPLSWGDYGLKDITKYIHTHSTFKDKATGETIPAFPDFIDSEYHTTSRGQRELRKIRDYFDRLVGELKDVNAKDKIRELFDQFTMSPEARMYNISKPSTAKPMSKSLLASKIQALVRDTVDSERGTSSSDDDVVDIASDEDEAMEATASGSVVSPTAEQNKNSTDIDELEHEIASGENKLEEYTEDSDEDEEV